MKRNSYTCCIFVLFIFCGLFPFKADAKKESCVQDLTKVEEGRKCRKECKKEADCKGQQKGCHCDNVCGMSCFNIDAECDPPNKPVNGRVRGDNYKYGGVIEYSCDEGYVLKGRKSQTCHADRKWGGLEPTCELGCAAPPRYGVAFPDADGDGFEVGSIVKYECRFGYIQIGEKEVTCGSDYKWSEFKFECTKVSCGDPGSPFNGYIEGSDFTFGSWIVYHCDKGFEIDDKIKNRRYCSTTARWSGEPRTCIKKKCPAPTHPDNGVAITTAEIHEFRSLVTYKCNFGYQLNGNSQGECNENGDWGVVPTCTVDVNCNFDGFDNPFCGYTNAGSGRWERVFIQDNTIFGHPTYVVRATSTPAIFSSPVILSDIPHCFRFHYFIDGRLSSSDVLTIVETEGRKVVGRIYRQEEKYTWMDQQITVMPGKVTKGIHFEISMSNNRVGIDLDEFSLSESACESHCDLYTCQNGGTCIDRKDEYSCACTKYFKGKNCEIEKRCPKIRSPRNGFYKVSPDPEVLRVNTEVVFSCDENYKISGPKSLVCLDTEKWSQKSRPVCREIICQQVSLPSGGRLTIEPAGWPLRVGTVIRFFCPIDRYLSRGPSAIVCNKLGRWSSDRRPICEDKKPVFEKCPKGYGRVWPLCYKTYGESWQTFEEATAECASAGARLSTIQSEEARKSLSKFLSSETDYYIGVSDIGRTEMRWSSGHEFVKISSQSYTGNFSSREKVSPASRCGVIRKLPARQWQISTAFSCQSRNRFICERFVSDVLPVRIKLRNGTTEENTVSIYRPMAGLIYNEAVIYKLEAQNPNLYLYRYKRNESSGWNVGEFSIRMTQPLDDRVALTVASPEKLPQNIRGRWEFGRFHEKDAKEADVKISVYDRWGPWSVWNTCSLTCGGGASVRQRFCHEKDGGAGFGDCPGYHLDVKDCATKQCIPTRWDEWEPWSKCTEPCDGGRQKRTRVCLKDPESLEKCPGRNSTEKLCNTQECVKVSPQWLITESTEYKVIIQTVNRRLAGKRCGITKPFKSKLASINNMQALKSTDDELRRLHCSGKSADKTWQLWVDLTYSENDTWVWGSGNSNLSHPPSDDEMLDRKGRCAFLIHECDTNVTTWTKASCSNQTGDGFICQRARHVCNRKPCENGGRCVKTKKNSNKTYRCKCPEAYEGDNCTEAISCKVDNLQKDFNVLKADTMKEIASDSILMNQTVVLACKDITMRAKGNKKFTCIDRDEWDRTPKLKCETICLVPNLHELITVKNNHEVLKAGAEVSRNTIVTFECPGNMKLRGNKTVQCKLGGWDNEFPTNCIKTIPCKGIEKPPNGSVVYEPPQPEDSYPIDTRIILKCDDELQVIGYKNATCNKDGEWTRELGVCSGDTGCALNAENYAFGTFTNRFKTVEENAIFGVGDTIEVHCPETEDRKIAFSGIVCREDLSWHPSIKEAMNSCE